MQSLKKKLTLNSKNDIRNLVNFNLSSGKSENMHFHVLLLSIAYKVSAEKVVSAKKIQRSCVVESDIMIRYLVNFHTSS